MLTENDYCDYDTSRELKELGFIAGLGEGDCGYCLHDDAWHDQVNRPLLYEAQKWLREEKGVIVEVFVDDDSDTPITYNVHKDGECVCHHHGRYWSVKEWETALLEGIKCAIKILKEDETILR